MRGRTDVVIVCIKVEVEVDVDGGPESVVRIDNRGVEEFGAGRRETKVNDG